jgi:hypothetical protein
MNEIDLPSGAKLRISLSSFGVSRELFQAVMEELKGTKMAASTEIDVNLFKDLFCAGFASKKIERAVWECMKKALYNGQKISEETFEAEEARQDYLPVMWEVAKANLNPFLKSLYAVFEESLSKIGKLPA